MHQDNNNKKDLKNNQSYDNNNIPIDTPKEKIYEISEGAKFILPGENSENNNSETNEEKKEEIDIEYINIIYSIINNFKNDGCSFCDMKKFFYMLYEFADILENDHEKNNNKKEDDLLNKKRNRDNEENSKDNNELNN